MNAVKKYQEYGRLRQSLLQTNGALRSLLKITYFFGLSVFDIDMQTSLGTIGIYGKFFIVLSDSDFYGKNNS